MIYERSFEICAAHFNDQKAYDILWSWLDDHKTTDDLQSILQPRIVWNELLHVVREVHGHNFKIDVTISNTAHADARYEVNQNFLIDDAALSEIVMGFDRRNLSLYDWFIERKIRATTENFATMLATIIKEDFPHLWCGVRVWETAQISAQCFARNVTTTK